MAAERAGARLDARTGGMRQVRSIAGLQRARLLSAAIGVLAEQGYEGFSAAAVCERAGVSRRTFYEVFENREQCFAALLREAAQRAGSVIDGLDLAGKAWGERVRLGLWALLCLADSDPALARVCLVESLRAGGLVQAERTRIFEKLIAAVDEGRLQRGSGSAVSGLIAEALVGAVSSVIATRMETASPFAGSGACPGFAGVRGLLGELMGMIVLPYQGPAAARKQIERRAPEAPVVVLASARQGAAGPDPLGLLPIRLTYRTARVLEAIAKLAQAGAGVSNRQIADDAEIADAGQTSKLLARLSQHGLIQNIAKGNHERGEANQWQLTPAGKRLMQSISPNAQAPRRSAA